MKEGEEGTVISAALASQLERVPSLKTLRAHARRWPSLLFSAEGKGRQGGGKGGGGGEERKKRRQGGEE